VRINDFDQTRHNAALNIHLSNILRMGRSTSHLHVVAQKHCGSHGWRIPSFGGLGQKIRCNSRTLAERPCHAKFGSKAACQPSASGVLFLRTGHIGDHRTDPASRDAACELVERLKRGSAVRDIVRGIEYSREQLSEQEAYGSNRGLGNTPTLTFFHPDHSGCGNSAAKNKG